MRNIKNLAAVIALVVAAALLAAPGPGAGATTAAAASSRIADPPWVGFRIDKTRWASSGWIGARKTAGGAKVYRVDPKKRKVTSRFGKRKWAARFMSSRSGIRVSRRNTSCAALLLGKYGARAADLQAAGVDVAIYHLLYGGSFRYARRAQIRRTDQRDNGPLIRAYAQQLIEEYCALRGPYRVSLTSSVAKAEVDDTIIYTLRVLSRVSVPMENIPITVSRGAETLEYVTDADGKVSFSWTPKRSGPLTIQTLAHNLPFSKVRYFVPRRQGSSRVVQAGLKQRNGYRRVRTIPILGQPTLRLDPWRPVTSGERLRTKVRLAQNYSSPRNAKVQLFGPFGSKENAECRPQKLARDSTLPVAQSGWYRSRFFTLRGRGNWYIWRVRVPGDDKYNKPVALCGWPFEVK